MNESLISDYFSQLAQAVEGTNCTNGEGIEIKRSQAFETVINSMRNISQNKHKILFCGNGGSAGICSHMAIDFFKNGGISSLALNDSSALTCLGNDFGFEFVFSKQIEMLAKPGDMVIAISSSGRSENILNGVKTGRDQDCSIVTFSGFDSDNPLRSSGDINFWVSAKDYGFVEASHLSLISAILEIHMGWPNIKYP